MVLFVEVSRCGGVCGGESGHGGLNATDVRR